MRPMPDGAEEVISSSHVGDSLIVHAWYGGELAAPDLQLTGEWSISEDHTRQVPTFVDLTVADDDGTLAPWALDDPLAPGGARLQVIYDLPDVGAVNMGWYTITAADPSEKWRLRRLPDQPAQPRLVWEAGGSTIPVRGDDLTRVAVRDELLANESPASGATVLSEVRRMLDGIMGVTVAAGVTDKGVPSSTVYEKQTPRMDVVEDLLAQIAAEYRTTGDGMLEVIPTTAQEPVWDVVPGDDGTLIQVLRNLSTDGMFNAVVSTSTELEVEAVGRSFETTGPLAWEGPAWRLPMFHSSPMITNATEALADARTTLTNRVRDRSVTLAVTCLPHPGLQVGDWVRVASPAVSGATVDLVGKVTQKTMRGSRSGVSPMTLRVVCDYADVQAIASALRR